MEDAALKQLQKIEWIELQVRPIEECYHSDTR